ncbi:glycosyltransferase family 4 protein [Mucilaginibacter sp. McL0603]|uniref:glycosyltransferase family 4 protein n=1 Tax=Mucilaginibacter sp. McL0603 TaxID=3415670 RepID=UPI003CE99ED2
MPKKIILFTLQTFSTTGGIQKMTRTLAYSLFHIAKSENWDFKLFSLYDSRYDLMNKYVPAENYTGFANNRIKLILKTINTASKSDIVILSHINFSLVGIIVKLLNPKCQVWLIAHGIEVWRPINFIKRTFLKKYCDKIICVSKFTKDQMIKWHQSAPEKCIVLNNAVDPFIKLPETFEKPEYLLNRYCLTTSNEVIFTLTRLASSEKYKGYEQAIKAVSLLKHTFPHIKYVLSGQYDSVEEVRIRHLINMYEADDQVILTGFLNETELTDHFLLSDLFVLPSKKEGFGIVFVEALACGLPVICGNEDGSVDAIRNGELGTAINVGDLDELEKTIGDALKTPLTIESRKSLQNQCLHYFKEDVYRNNLQKLLNDEPVS